MGIKYATVPALVSRLSFIYQEKNTRNRPEPQDMAVKIPSVAQQVVSFIRLKIFIRQSIDGNEYASGEAAANPGMV
jgi:hypothetical protein